MEPFFETIGLTKKLTRSRLGSFLKENAGNSGLTLDLGCGGGYYKVLFPKRIGFDIEKGPGVDVVGDAHCLPFESEYFDTILCTEVLEHLHTPQKAISEMRRVLKKGGKLILTTRFIFPLHAVPSDYYRFTRYGLLNLFQNGWEIVSLKEQTSTIETFAVLLQRLAFQTKMPLKMFKVPILILAKIVPLFSFLIKKEFGDIGKKNEEKGILSSGYYLLAKKI